jgi:EGF-like domain
MSYFFYLPFYLGIIFQLFLLTQACTSDLDCDLNGVCTDGLCVCDPGWIGSDCGQLDLRAGPRANGYNLTGDGTSSWCNGIVQDPVDEKLFHLIVSEFTYNCGLNYWSPYSRIIRAESTNGPLGPYSFRQQIAPHFAHNPSVIWSEPDQLYLLFNIGCPTSLNTTSCENQNTYCGPGNDVDGESGITAWSSPNLRDWTSHGQVFQGANDSAWDADLTNPGPFALYSNSDKTAEILMSYRGCPYNCSGAELINIASTPNYWGPYTELHPSQPIFTEGSEDPFLWEDKRGNFHLLVHSLLPDGGFGNGPNVGRHAYATKWNGDWTFNLNTVAYNTTAHFTDGSTINYYRRERPHLYFSTDGQMTPLYLSTGVQEVNSPQSYSLIQPIGDGAAEYEQSLGF